MGNKYGFNSMRAHYAKLKKDKEAAAVQKAGIIGERTQQNIVVPVDGETPTDVPYPPVEPPFVPYEEPSNEGLIIEDDVFATMISLDGTVQIDDNIYRLDLVNNVVSYIPASAVSRYDEFLVANLTTTIEQIRYFGMSDDVLDLVNAGDVGSTTAAAALVRFDVSSGRGADWNKDAGFIYFDESTRLDCKLTYQKLGIWFSMIAKAHNQRQTWYGAWVGSPNALVLTTPSGVAYEPKRDGTVTIDIGSYNNGANSSGKIENGNDNTVKRRYYGESKALKRYKAEVQFGYSNSRNRTRVFRIESKW